MRRSAPANPPENAVLGIFGSVWLLSIALRPLDLPAEVKAVAVALTGVICSYAASWFLISRVPGVARIL